MNPIGNSATPGHAGSPSAVGRPRRATPSHGPSARTIRPTAAVPTLASAAHQPPDPSDTCPDRTPHPAGLLLALLLVPRRPDADLTPRRGGLWDNVWRTTDGHCSSKILCAVHFSGTTTPGRVYGGIDPGRAESRARGGYYLRPARCPSRLSTQGSTRVALTLLATFPYLAGWRRQPKFSATPNASSGDSTGPRGNTEQG